MKEKEKIDTTELEIYMMKYTMKLLTAKGFSYEQAMEIAKIEPYKWIQERKI